MEDKNGENRSGHQISIDPARKTRQSHTIEHAVNKIIS